ncbi:MAG: hypothetical protein ACR2HS_01365, partial [Gammaproteobacteria bacterium]
MTPQELNQTIENKDNPEDSKTEEKEEFTLEPVRAEVGDDAPENKEVSTETKPASNEGPKGNNEVVYKALIKELVSGGIITAAEADNLDELPGNLDTIKDLLNKTIEQGVDAKQQDWKKSLPSEKKRFLEIEDAFDQTDQAIIMAQRLEFFDSLTTDAVSENPTLQKQLYFEHLKSKNFSDQEAMEAVEDADAVGKLEQKALEAIPKLKEQSASIVEQSRAAKQEMTAKAQEAQTKAFESLLNDIDSRESFIDGLNLNKISRDKLKNNIIEPIYKDPKTGKEFNSLMYKQMKNPAEFEMLINYYDTLGLFNITKEGKFRPDISKIKAVAKTAAITELDKVISVEEQRGV